VVRNCHILLNGIHDIKHNVNRWVSWHKQLCCTECAFRKCNVLKGHGMGKFTERWRKFELKSYIFIKYIMSFHYVCYRKPAWHNPWTTQDVSTKITRFIEYGRLKDMFLRNLAPGYSCILRDVSATSILLIHRICYECTPAFERNAALEINQIDGCLSKKQDEPLTNMKSMKDQLPTYWGDFQREWKLTAESPCNIWNPEYAEHMLQYTNT